MLAFQHVAYSASSRAAVIAARVPRPSKDSLKPGEILLRTCATGMNAGDTFVGSGAARAVFNMTFPSTVGRDVAGVVEAVGVDVNATVQEAPLRVGDRVVAYVGFGGGRGTFSEYVIANSAQTFVIPPAVSYVDAASLPTAGCTAYMALVSSGVLVRGGAQRVLIIGGSSGIGVIALQLARVYGATEIAAVSSQRELCLSLGATTVIDHRRGEDWGATLAGRNFDVILDCAEGLTAWGKAQRVLRPGGTFVSCVMDSAFGPITLGGIAVFLARMMWRSMWALFGYTRFIQVSNMGNVDGLAPLVALMSAGSLRAVLHAPPEPCTIEGFGRMWDAQISHRTVSHLGCRCQRRGGCKLRDDYSVILLVLPVVLQYLCSTGSSSCAGNLSQTMIKVARSNYKMPNNFKLGRQAAPLAGRQCQCGPGRRSRWLFWTECH